MSWHNGLLVLFDIESTGVDPHRDRIVTAAVIEVGAGRESRTHSWLLDPGIPIPQGASDVHGISTDFASHNGMAAAGGVWEIAETLLRCVKAGAPVVGHNVGGYDLTMLWAESIRHGHREHVTALEDLAAGDLGHVIDTAVIEKALDPFRPGKPNGKRPDDACGSHRLIDCCRLWGVDLTEAEAHGAEADALAAGRLAWRLATDPERFAPFDSRPTARINPANFTLPALHAWQKQTKREQAESLAAYFVKQGKPDDVSRSWPLQEPPPDWSPDQLPTPREDAAA